MIRLHDELKSMFDGKATEMGSVLSSRGDQYTVRLADGRIIKGVVQEGVTLDPGASVSVVLGDPNIIVPSGITSESSKRIYI